MTESCRKAVEYFDKHAEYYEESQYHTARRTFINGRHDTIVAVLNGLRLPSGTRILDAGCGPGNLCVEFAKRGYQVWAIDTSPNMLKRARSNVTRVQRKPVTFSVATIERLPFASESFDVVCSAGVIEYLPNCDAAIAEFRRVLKRGGLLILPTTNLLAPAHWFRHVLSPIAKVGFVSRWFGVRPGDYRMWFHVISRFRQRLRRSGIVIERERYFYFTLPRPLDRVFPKLAMRTETAFDRYMDTPLRHLAEGYIAIGRKPETTL